VAATGCGSHGDDSPHSPGYGTDNDDERLVRRSPLGRRTVLAGPPGDREPIDGRSSPIHTAAVAVEPAAPALPGDRDRQPWLCVKV